MISGRVVSAFFHLDIYEIDDSISPLLFDLVHNLARYSRCEALGAEKDLRAFYTPKKSRHTSTVPEFCISHTMKVHTVRGQGLIDL